MLDDLGERPIPSRTIAWTATSTLVSRRRERPALRRGTSGSFGRDVRRPDPRDVVAQDLDLPRGRSRERVKVHTQTYTLRGSEVRTLATVGAFRVVPAEDLRVGSEPRPDARTGDLYHLREAGLVRTIPYLVGRHRTTLVVLTERGRDLLESHRVRSDERAQTFYAGALKPRELTHDSQTYRAYLHAAERLTAQGADIRRVVLDYELKRDYQRFLQQRNRARRRTGRTTPNTTLPIGRRHGRATTACPSTTTTCSSRTSGSSTSTRTAAARSRTSRS